MLVLAPVFFRKPTARKTEINDSSAAVRNIWSYACAEGNVAGILGMVPRYICWYIPATEGPSEFPTSIKSTDMPRETPCTFCGDDIKIMLKHPTMANDNPTEITASVADMAYSVP